MAYQILVSDPLSDDKIYQLRQAVGLNIDLTPEQLGERWTILVRF